MYSIELGDDNCLSRRSDALCVECGSEVQEGSARMPDGSSSKGGICLIECEHCPATAGQQWREPGAEGGDKGVKEDTRVIFKVATAETDGDGARVRRRQRSGRGNKRGISKSVVADSHTRGYQLCRHVIYADYQPKRSQTGKDEPESEACDWASADEDERWETSTRRICSLPPCGFVGLAQFYPRTPPGFDMLRLEGWRVVPSISPCHSAPLL